MKRYLAVAGASAFAVLGLSTGGVTAASAAAVSCHAINGHVATKALPDRKCTPGVTYSVVTQATIGKTICKKGWTATVRPPESYTEPIKIAQIAQYHYADKRVSQYEEDHLIPLELGGSPRSVKNLWPEYDAGHIPNPKDAVENALKRGVCSHKFSLKAAQIAIAVNWTTARAHLHV
jgi:hypothetical protein